MARRQGSDEQQPDTEHPDEQPEAEPGEQPEAEGGTSGRTTRGSYITYSWDHGSLFMS
jgi:hypothetical protein